MLPIKLTSNFGKYFIVITPMLLRAVISFLSNDPKTHFIFLVWLVCLNYALVI